MLQIAHLLLDGTYRNRKMLDMAESNPCIRCLIHKSRFTVATVVAAHYTGEFQHLLNKGGSHKAHDHCSWWACHTCHTEADDPSVKWPEGEKGELQMLYILLTLSIILKNNPEVFRRGN